MVGIIRRMNNMRALLGVRHGPGAAVLPPEVTRIHMEFAMRWNEGHLGPRKFWRLCLPRLKYWNPAIPMIVNRTTDQAGSAPMTVYFRQSGQESAPAAAAAATTTTMSQPPVQPSSSAAGQSKATPPAADERIVTIEMKGRRSEHILAEFLEKTGAVPVVPTPQEEVQLRELEERKERSGIDRKLMRDHLDAKRREAAIISAARSEAAALNAEN